MKQNLSPEIII